MPLPFGINPMATLQTESTFSSGQLFPLLPQPESSPCASPDLSPETSKRMDKKKIAKPVAKKSRISLEDKDQKTKERILRNRAAAQESRDKKRRYVADLESNNNRLTDENEVMNKRIKLLESQNQLLMTVLTQMQPHLNPSVSKTLMVPSFKISNQDDIDSTSLLAHGFCDSAAEVVQQVDDLNQVTRLAGLPSPMLSPQVSSAASTTSSDDEASVMTPELYDLFDWDGQQCV
ncbi:hypothetical protein DM01DRAFT_1335440 [Hesseltinella vesiculosa]|uniref:BZIP domain-containing protein n=1 Tax=Hesseltinella vesiculosa TaxID=101127 RepID=A0A1X2GKN8_9FUNG|nr:hypothetical protein DM01DRAFT_1335440 [Hesseltinella vesiculosa]